VQDYVEIMGGLDSPGFAHFKKLFKEGFETARKHSDSIISEFTVHRSGTDGDRQLISRATAFSDGGTNAEE